MKTENMKQRGVIVCGAGLNKRRWMDDAKAQGYAVLDCGGYVELWK